MVDTLRKRAWPKLVGLEKHSKPKESSSTPIQPSDDPPPKFEIDTALLTRTNVPSSLDLLVECMDKDQIDRDVARCTWHLLTGSQRSRRNQIKSKDKSKKVASILKKKQRRLANLINLTLVESYSLSKEKLRYYQGYHDVACIFLHALGGAQSSRALPRKDPLGLDLASRVLCQVSFSHFRDNLRNNFVSLQTALKVALYPLLLQLDVQVHNHLQDCDMEPFFCLSWVLTWFSHDVRDTNLCKRLFDAFLASHPLFVIYVAIAMILHPYNRKLILETDCDFAALHQCLVSLPRNSCKVGWKRSSWEGGYVSHDDDEDDATDVPDDMTTSTDMDTPSCVAPSTVSSRASFHLGATTIEEGAEQQVPFQGLIDTALNYMAKYPPRCLGQYARRYYGEELSSISGIALLQDAPTWSLVSTAQADWVLKQRLRQELGLTPTSRKDRRKKASAPKTEADTDVSDCALPVDYEYLKRHSRDRAVIAVGYGPGPEAILERKKRNRRLAASVALGFLTMTVGLALYHYSNDRKTNVIVPAVKSQFVKKLVEERRSNATFVSTATEILSTSAAETADSVLEYCKLPITYILAVTPPTNNKDETVVKRKDDHAVVSVSASASQKILLLPSSSPPQRQKSVARQEHNPLIIVNTTRDGNVALATIRELGEMIERLKLNFLQYLMQPLRALLTQGRLFLHHNSGMDAASHRSKH